MQQICRQCSTAFDITDADLAFYEKVSPVFAGKKELIPPPTLCPECRKIQRGAMRNERSLYRRICDKTGKSIISFYTPEALFKVYDKDAWWSDTWDALDYGRNIDLSSSFFEQWHALQKQVPRLGMVLSHDEGSAFCGYCTNVKQCYMCTSLVIAENAYYCYQANDSRDCMDSHSVTKCEQAFECIHCFSLYHSAFCKDCESSSDLLFCQDCHNCRDCIGCKSLVGREHCIFNRQATEKECAEMRESIAKRTQLEAIRDRCLTHFITLPTRATHMTQCENCTGDHLRNCRNCHMCFDTINAEDCVHMGPIPGLGTKDCQDCNYSPGSELVFNAMSGMRCQRARFVLHSWDNEDVLYTDECFNSHHLFGCIGLKHKRYCILNKQYTKEEYEELVPKIIEKMRADGEWGEFFPVTMSPFAYNETVAQEYFPMTKEEVLARGWKWRDQTDEIPKVEKILPAAQLPDSIDDIPDDILNWAIECDVTKRPFKIIKQELEFYRQMRLPVPRFHPDERHRRRMALRNPRKLWDRECAKCRKTIATSYSPDRPEIVYCERCYLETVY
jgi:hypothetical protein